MLSILNSRQDQGPVGPKLSRVSLVILVIVLLGAAAGCGGTKADRGPDRPFDPMTGVAGEFPLTLIDDSDRTVTIPQPPQRIVVLAPSHVEILFALGLSDRIVGIDDFADTPAATADIPRVGGVYDPNIERMLELEPDLFLSVQGSEAIADRLTGFGIPAYISQPETFDEILTNIELIGRITGAEDAAADLSSELAARRAAVRAAVADAPPVRVFIEIWHDPLMTVGPGAYIHDLIEQAGGVNLAADAQIAWPQIGLETVVERDPDVIVVLMADSLRELQENRRPGWGGLRAVKEGRVYLIDEDLISRPGPRAAAGLEALAGFFHPEGWP